METNQKQLLTIKEVQQLTGFSRTTIYKLFKNGEFPPPLKFGRSSRWNAGDVMKAISTQ